MKNDIYYSLATYSLSGQYIASVGPLVSWHFLYSLVKSKEEGLDSLHILPLSQETLCNYVCGVLCGCTYVHVYRLPNSALFLALPTMGACCRLQIITRLILLHLLFKERTIWWKGYRLAGIPFGW